MMKIALPSPIITQYGEYFVIFRTPYNTGLHINSGHQAKSQCQTVRLLYHVIWHT